MHYPLPSHLCDGHESKKLQTYFIFTHEKFHLIGYKFKAAKNTEL